MVRCFLLAIFIFISPLMASSKTPANISEVAEKLIKELGDFLLKNKPRTGRYKIAVFAFGNSNGEATSAMGNLPVLIQGEITRKLHAFFEKKKEDKFTVLETEQLKSAFKRRRLEPSGIEPGNLPFAAKMLKRARIDLAIMGKFDFEDPNAAYSSAVRIESTALFSRSKKSLLVKVGVKTKGAKEDSGINSKEKSGRFKVEFYMKSNSNWQLLKLYKCHNPKSEFHNVFFLPLEEDVEGKEYKIRLINKGIPAIFPSPLDKDRLIPVALFIDGVNSFYQERGEDTGPVIVHPLNAKKWVLTAPGRRLKKDRAGTIRRLGPNTTKIKNGKLVNTTKKDHSWVDVKGFKVSRKYAKAFVFARPRESIAEEIGITEKIGMMTVYFYTEKMPGSKGTIAGKKVKNPTFKVEFEYNPRPVEIWPIFYRYKDDLPVPMKDLTLVD